MSDSFTIHHQDRVEPHPDLSFPDPHQDIFSLTTLGFWVYLMTDCLLFATLFITYAVLHDSTFGGPNAKELFSLSLAFAETMVLLFSSLTCGLGMLSAVRSNKNKTIFWLAISFILGFSFVVMELTEFTNLVAEGNSWTKSAFLSSFFTLVGTHGTHVSIGLIWMAVMVGQIIYSGINIFTFRKLVIFSMFWHFLDLVWIFIFTFVYLMGAI